MVESGDQEFLRSIFLMEAWDTFAAIEQGVGCLIRGDEPAWDELFLVLHRLTGAAALQGFGRIASMAEAMEQTVRPLRNGSAEARALVAPRVGEQVASLKAALDAIEQGAEPSALEAAPSPRPAGPSPASPAAGPDPLRAELAAFFTANDDVLSYFGPEAAEHLETMTAAVLSLEREGASEAGIAALFRAVHTLKGAAYVVGCRPIGELAHGLEDVLVTVREGGAAVTPAVLEASLAAVDCFKHMLDPAADAILDLTREAAGVRSRVAALLQTPPAAPTAPAEGAPPAVPQPSTPAPAETPQRPATPPARPAHTPARERAAP
jgi:chemosensory pili system protein ChpA (sensor histidine kinase/response regulator)